MTEERYIFGRGAPRNTPAWATVKGLIDEWNERYDTANSSERSRIVDEEVINVVGEQNFFRRCSDGTLIVASRRDFRSHLQTKFSHKNKNKPRPSPEAVRSAVPVQQQKLASIQGQREPQVPQAPQATSRQEAAHWEKPARPEITRDKNSKVLFVKQDAARHVSRRQPSWSIGEHTYTQGNPLMQHDIMVRSTEQHYQASAGDSTSRHTVAPKNVPLQSQHLAAKQEATQQYQGASFYPLGESVEVPLDLFEGGFDFESDEELGLLGLQRLPNGTVPVMFCTEQDLGATENHQIRNEGDTPQREELAGCEATRVLPNGDKTPAPRKTMEETLVARRPPPTDYLDDTETNVGANENNQSRNASDTLQCKELATCEAKKVSPNGDKTQASSKTTEEKLLDRKPPPAASLDDEEISTGTTKTFPSTDGGSSPPSSPLSDRSCSSQDELWTQPRAPYGFRIVRVTMACQVCTTPFEMHVLDVPEFQCTYCKRVKHQHRKTRSDDDDPDDTAGNKDNQNNNNGKSDKRENGGLGQSQGGNESQSKYSGGASGHAKSACLGSTFLRLLAKASMIDDGGLADVHASSLVDEADRHRDQEQSTHTVGSSAVPTLPRSSLKANSFVPGQLDERKGGSEQVYHLIDERISQYLCSPIKTLDPVTQTSRVTLVSDVLALVKRLGGSFKIPGTDDGWHVANDEIAHCLIAHLFWVRSRQHHNSQVPPVLWRSRLASAFHKQPPVTEIQSISKHQLPTFLSSALSTTNCNDGLVTSSAQFDMLQEHDDAKPVETDDGKAPSLQQNASQRGATVGSHDQYGGVDMIPSLTLLADTAMGEVVDSKMSLGSTSTPPIDLTRGLAWNETAPNLLLMSSTLPRDMLLLNSAVANSNHAMRHAPPRPASTLRASTTALRVVESNAQSSNKEVDSAKRQFYAMRLSETDALGETTKKLKVQHAVLVGAQETALVPLEESGTNKLHQGDTADDMRIPQAITSKYKAIQTLTGHSHHIACCAMWNDGRNLLSGCYDKTLKVWERQNDGQYHCIQTLKGHSRVCCCTVWNDGRNLLSGHEAKYMKVWRRKRDGQYQRTQIIRGHSSAVRCCAVWNDGRHLLSGSDDKTLKVWERQSDNGKHQCIQTLKGHSDPVWCCAVWNDGRHLLSGSHGKTLKVWERQSDGQYQCIQTLQGHSTSVWCCAVWNDGQHLLSGSRDKTLKVWERQSDGQYQCIQTLQGHSRDVSCCAVWNDGRHLLSGSWDNTLKMWERQSDGQYQCIQTLQGHSSWGESCAVSDNGQLLVSGSTDMTLKVWKLEADEADEEDNHTSGEGAYQQFAEG